METALRQLCLGLRGRGHRVFVLVAAERSDIVLVASITALIGALALSGATVLLGGTALAAAAEIVYRSACIRCRRISVTLTGKNVP